MSSKGTVLVTGGAQRIGKQICLFLAQKGFRVALHYSRSRHAANATAQEILSQGGTCKTFASDLSNPNATRALIRTVKKSFPDLNLLINNAAVFAPTSDKNYAESFEEHMLLNLKAPYILTFEFSRLCSSGQIINMLDTRVTQNDTQYLAYTLSKKGLMDWTELSAAALAPRIRVNAIAPGLVLPPSGKDLSYINKLAQRIPLKHKASMENILKAVEFLLDNRDMTGQVLYIDGGRHLL